MKRALMSAALVATLLPQALAEDRLSQIHVFQDSTTTRTKSGAAENVRISVESWGITGERRGKGVAQEIPLRGFYLAHLLSGQVVTTINGETALHSPGDYWAVKPGATMQVRTLGGYAMLETTILSKQ